jgi:hypothetical protein
MTVPLGDLYLCLYLCTGRTPIEHQTGINGPAKIQQIRTFAALFRREKQFKASGEV